MARVEQTQTPAMLKETNAALPRGVKKKKVVARELCSVRWLHTRYCGGSTVHHVWPTTLERADQEQGHQHVRRHRCKREGTHA